MLELDAVTKRFGGLVANNAVAMTATAGVGYQITPQISIEGSVGFTQIQGAPLR